MELVRYLPGELWQPHMSCGALQPADDSRRYGVHVFLNTMPKGAGGELVFPSLGVQFVPRAGHVVWWRPTTEENGSTFDSLVQERPTLPGSPPKYVLMIWIRRERVVRK
jgi:hypothetical protein